MATWGVLDEGLARLLLIAHLLAAFAVIGLTTHSAIWLRRYVRGAHGLRRVAAKFAAWAAVAYAAAFVLGNIVYPTYKVRVRLEYLDDSVHVMRARELAMERRQVVAARLAPASPDAQPLPGGIVVAAERGAAAGAIARLFDTKEHWVVMGLLLAVGCALMLRRWRIDEPGGEVMAPFLLGFAYGAAAIAWYGGIVGALVSIWRAV